MGVNISDWRKDYKKNELQIDSVKLDPLLQFENWLEDAKKNTIDEPNAMILSTCGINQRPSSRTVLLKMIKDGGFIFFTNYGSRKSKQINENPYASLLFFWKEMERQVRIEGIIKKVDSTLSEQYFNSRPEASKISAIVSPQSNVINDRNTLEKKVEEFQKNPELIKRPEYWGGFCLIPDYYEFWQGRSNRLHDRIQYSLEDSKDWKISRLAP